MRRSSDLARRSTHGGGGIFAIHSDFFRASSLYHIIIRDIGVSLKLVTEADFVCRSWGPLAFDVVFLDESVHPVARSHSATDLDQHITDSFQGVPRTIHTPSSLISGSPWHLALHVSSRKQ